MADFSSQSELYWLHDVVDAGRFVNVSIAGNQSLRAFLERAGVHSQLPWLMVAAFVAALGVVIGVRLARQHQWFLAVGVVGTCSVVVSPISWTHHQFWLLGPALWALVQPRLRVRSWGAVVLVVMTVGVIDAPPALGPLGWLITDLHLLAALSVLAVAASVSIRPGQSGEPNDADAHPVSAILTGPSGPQ